MALSNLTTPGVYVQEISTLPSSIVPVETAIPGFLGYTEKTIINGVQWNYGTNLNPIPAPAVRITSFVEFQNAFGGAFRETFDVAIDVNGTPTVTPSSSGSNLSPYTFFFHMQMYFANGGGPCHIISVGNYDYTTPSIDADHFYKSTNALIGIGQAAKVDEITLLVAPEVIEIGTAANVKGVYDAMLAQCNALQDRFSIFDVASTGAANTDGSNFRGSYVGVNYLKYGAAYYPPLVTTLSRTYSADEVVITSDSRTSPNLYNTQPNNRLSTIFSGKGNDISVLFNLSPVSLVDGISITVGSTTVSFVADLNFAIGLTDADTIANLIAAINNHPVLSLVARAQLQNASSTNFYIIARQGSSTLTVTSVVLGAAWITPTSNTTGASNSQDIALYNKIKSAIGNLTGLTLAPSATMAGIYAAVDNDRGVWKAPANVGVTGIVGPSVMVTEGQQGDLNVDATSGKSINVIRSFVGRGTVIWGSRTLDGNSNEWRYVPVRRLFIFAEESCKKATEFVVFEPNNKNTWLSVKGTISNFLTDLWKQGALAGDKPDQAFFVKVGLGETMTAQDILEGKMIVTIGMAAVRPAEFIVLQFMHKLQEA